jgi:pimeloyl-ACP methyl ester carboxylesterase
LIALFLRLAWVAVLCVIAGAAWLSIRLFGARIGPSAAALTGVFVVCAMHPFVIAFNFLMSRIAGDRVPAALRLSPWQAIRTYDAEIDASVRGFWFANPFLEGRPAPRPRAGTKERPFALLFLHGYFCNRAIWHSFMKDAASRGYRCEAVTLDEGFSSIDSHADVVDRAIDRLIGGGAARVVLVAHSMGGLVARACLQTIDATRIAHVFTLGTPHRGTRAARFGLATSVAQMRRDSPWLQALASRETHDRLGLPHAAYTTIFSYHDDIVYPQTTGCLDGAECIAIGGCGHVSLLYDRRIRTIVFDRLEALEGRQAATGDAS